VGKHIPLMVILSAIILIVFGYQIEKASNNRCTYKIKSKEYFLNNGKEYICLEKQKHEQLIEKVNE